MARKILSAHAESLWQWKAREDERENAVPAPRTLAQVLYPHLRTEARAAPVAQRKGNLSVAEALYPNHRRES
jgi:hypothetical protein